MRLELERSLWHKLVIIATVLPTLVAVDRFEVNSAHGDTINTTFHLEAYEAVKVK